MLQYIYTHLDTKPLSFEPTSTFRIKDFYAVPDQVGLPSFHFIASMSRHPTPFLTAQLALGDALLYTRDGFLATTQRRNVVRQDIGMLGNSLCFTSTRLITLSSFLVPGPRALRSAMEMFVRSHDLNGNQSSHMMVNNFTFHGGMGGHTRRRDRRTCNKIVMECAIRDKENQFQSNNVTHYPRSNTGSHWRTLLRFDYEVGQTMEVRICTLLPVCPSSLGTCIRDPLSISAAA
jgi:hypothetical protein